MIYQVKPLSPSLSPVTTCNMTTILKRPWRLTLDQSNGGTRDMHRCRTTTKQSQNDGTISRATHPRQYSTIRPPQLVVRQGGAPPEIVRKGGSNTEWDDYMPYGGSVTVGLIYLKVILRRENLLKALHY